MSMRIHTTNADALAVQVFTASENLVDVYGPEFADVPMPALVFEDALNCEALVIAGTLPALAQLLAEAGQHVITQVEARA